MTHPRRTALIGSGLALVALAAIVVTDPFDSGKPSHTSKNAVRTSLATVTRRSLSSQTQVSATLGYGGASNIRLPSGTPPSTVQQTEHAVRSGEQMLRTVSASLAVDSTALANARATVTAALQKQSVDCAGSNAAQAVPSSSPPSGEAAPSGSPSSDGDVGLCASDVQALASEQLTASAAAIKLQVDRASLSSTQSALSSAHVSALAARSTATDYGQGATFTQLPALGQVISRGQSVFALSGRPTVLLYGSLVPAHAFVAGMAPGEDVQVLNANLVALGYGSGASGETFSAATEAALREFQSARGMAVTGELRLGSVVFEPGPVRVTNVTPELGASATPGPVLGISSTRPQVTIALSAAQQSSVKVGDRVSIALPDQQTTPGVISSVGTVAKAPASKDGSGGSGASESGEEGGPTVEVDVTPSQPRAIGHLDESPAEVSITTASLPEALCVPVDALLALAGGGYALEVAEGSTRHLEAVTLGLFDDAEGLVQLTGKSVHAGQRVVVPT